LQSERSLDATDWRILRELQQDGRLSYNELGRRVAFSAPAAERVRKLEDRGIITGYSAQIDPAQVELPLLSSDTTLTEISGADHFRIPLLLVN
jgi:Lrp/AsnC family leucine-responsive transcriptional regulator